MRDLDDLVKQALDAVAALSPEQQREMWEAQRQSWARGEAGLDLVEQVEALIRQNTRLHHGKPTDQVAAEIIDLVCASSCNTNPVVSHETPSVADRAAAPAATDTGLVTFCWIKEDGSMWFNQPEGTSKALCLRPQAEELLAAERAEKERLADDYQAIREQLHRGWQECCALKADNAAQDAENAYLKELVAARGETIKRGDDHIRKLEAKLTAAEKALERIAARDGIPLAGSFAAEIARAVLGGKPSC